MEKVSYNKISGKKTLALVITLIVLIIALSVYSIFLVVRKSSVITNSSYYEGPDAFDEITPTPQSFPDYLQRSGD
jgi:uncharacterized membrane protein YukC